jgi:hypothetical protein
MIEYLREIAHNEADRYNYGFEVYSTNYNESKLVHPNTCIITKNGFNTLSGLYEEYNESDIPSFTIVDNMNLDQFIKKGNWKEIELDETQLSRFEDNILTYFEMVEKIDNNLISYGIEISNTGVARISLLEKIDNEWKTTPISYKRFVPDENTEYTTQIVEKINCPIQDGDIISRLKNYDIDFLENYIDTNLNELISWFEEWILPIDELVNEHIFLQRRKAVNPRYNNHGFKQSAITYPEIKGIYTRSIARFIEFVNVYSQHDLTNTDYNNLSTDRWRNRIFTAYSEMLSQIGEVEEKILSVTRKLYGERLGNRFDTSITSKSALDFTPISQHTSESINVYGYNYSFGDLYEKALLIPSSIDRDSVFIGEYLAKAAVHERLHDNRRQRNADVEEILVSIVSIIIPDYFENILDPTKKLDMVENDLENSLCVELRTKFINLREYYRTNDKFDDFENLLKLMFESLYDSSDNLLSHVYEKLLGRTTRDISDASGRLRAKFEQIKNDPDIPKDAKISDVDLTLYEENSSEIKRVHPGESESKQIMQMIQSRLKVNLKSHVNETLHE